MGSWTSEIEANKDETEKFDGSIDNTQLQDENDNINNIDPNLHIDEYKNSQPLEIDQNNDTLNAWQRLAKAMNKYSNTTDSTRYYTNGTDHTSIINILNDFHRLQRHADDEPFQMMVNELIDCDITKCIMFRRNFRDRSKVKNRKDIYPNESDTIFCQILDKIHCFFQHSHDIGQQNNHIDIKNQRLSVKYHTVAKYKFGWEFNYATTTTNTEITECKNNHNIITITKMYQNLK
eukprot:279814_1